MGILEILKMLNEQGDQVIMIDQVELLNEAVVALNANINTLNFRISCTWWVLLSIIVGLEVLNLWYVNKLDKRIKKIEGNDIWTADDIKMREKQIQKLEHSFKKVKDLGPTL